MGSAPNEELCLRWNDFESILSRSFNEMRSDSDFFDVKIACFDQKSVMKTLPAHRVVLSACSPVFKELLRAINSPDSKNPLIFLRGISYHEMQAVLDFMYNGQTKVNHTELDGFLAAAEELKIKGLTSNQSDSSKKRKNEPPEHYETKPKIKKSKRERESHPGPSNSHQMAGNSNNEIVNVKNEVAMEPEVEHAEPEPVNEDSYGAYPEADVDAGNEDNFDESGTFQDDGAPMDAFPRDSKEYYEPTEEQREEMLKNYMIEDDFGNMKCKLCGFVYNCRERYNRRKHLENHIENQHLKIPAYPCYYCTKVFYSKHRRICHISSKHKEEHKNNKQFHEVVIKQEQE